jgi:hypothetical protein
MKKFKMLLIAVLILTSVSIFAQVAPNNQTMLSKQNPEKAKYICPMHPNMVMDNLCKGDLRSPLNLSLKEKMKGEEIKGFGLMNSGASTYLPCAVSNDDAALNLSPKDKLKWETMRISNFHPGSYVNAAYTCRMMVGLNSNKKICCVYSSPILNLSTKEKMKRQVMKI